MFPVENWYDLTRNLPTTQLVVFPRAGHGPSSSSVEASVALITSFIATTR